MPKASDHSSTNLQKLLYIGDCIAGGTIVSVKRGTKARKMSIAELYKRHNGNHHNKQNITTEILADCGGYAAPNELVAVTNSGEKELLLIETRNRKIRTSLNHFFKTDEGWIKAKDLEKGTAVASWRSIRETFNLKEPHSVTNPRNIIYSIPYHPNGWANWVAGRNYKRIALAYLVIEAGMNGLTVKELIKILRRNPLLASSLHYLPIGTVIHHLDGNQENDDIDNLQIVTDEEHNLLHQEVRVKASKVIEHEPIISIERGGLADTFDLSMKDPHNNFIANGFVVHNSATGKTTSLFSLVAAGYKLRIFDFDNLLSPLISITRKQAPDKLDNIEFMSFRDDITTTQFGPIVPNPKAFVDGLKALYKWEDGSKPPEWGPEYIAVVDSLTTMSRAAMFWGRGMQGGGTIAEGVPMKGFDGRAAFFTAQQAIMNAIAFLTSESFHANVIMIAHIKYLEQDGAIKGFPMSAGTAILSEIPTYFPSVALATKNKDRRVIRTRSTNMIDLKNPRAFDREFAEEISMDTGLAQYFERNPKS